jgi:hypothetical protein
VFFDAPLTGEYEGYVHATFGLQTYTNFSGEMVFLNSLEEQEALCFGRLQDFLNVSGKVVGFVTPQVTTRVAGYRMVNGGCSYETMVASCVRANCSALLQFGQVGDDDGFEILSRDWWDARNSSTEWTDGREDQAITFPVYVCLLDTLDRVFGYNISDMPVVLSSNDSNFAIIAAGYGTFFRVAFSIWTLFNLLCAILFLVRQVYDHKRSKKVGQFPELAVSALSFEIFCNVLRFAYVVVDPFWVTTKYPSPVHLIFGTACFSFSLCATLIIAVFWFKSVKLSNRQVKLMSDCATAVLVSVLCLVIFAGEYIPGALRVALLALQQTSQVAFVLFL